MADTCDASGLFCFTTGASILERAAQVGEARTRRSLSVESVQQTSIFINACLCDVWVCQPALVVLVYISFCSVAATLHKSWKRKRAFVGYFLLGMVGLSLVETRQRSIPLLLFGSLQLLCFPYRVGFRALAWAGGHAVLPCDARAEQSISDGLHAGSDLQVRQTLHRITVCDGPLRVYCALGSSSSAIPNAVHRPTVLRLVTRRQCLKSSKGGKRSENDVRPHNISPCWCIGERMAYVVG